MTTQREELRSSWEVQQAGHAPDRELRFRLILDYVEALAGPPRRVLDLCCGPGSLTRRVLERFPEAEVVAIDVDPVLLDLARDAFAGDDRVSVVARQLAAPDWYEGLPGTFDTVVTATAMHWFPADALAGVYAGVARVLRSGGVFANADHIPIAEPVLRSAADRRTPSTCGRRSPPRRTATAGTSARTAIPGTPGCGPNGRRCSRTGRAICSSAKAGTSTCCAVPVSNAPARSGGAGTTRWWWRSAGERRGPRMAWRGPGTGRRPTGKGRQP